MRSSVYQDDPGFANFKFGKTIVFLNGEPVSYCITADDEAGYVLVYDMDENGNFKIDDKQMELCKTILFGRVEIRQATPSEYAHWRKQIKPTPKVIPTEYRQWPAS